MDATANEIEEVQVEGFPTLKLFKKETNEIVDYRGTWHHLDHIVFAERMLLLLELRKSNCLVLGVTPIESQSENTFLLEAVRTDWHFYFPSGKRETEDMIKFVETGEGGGDDEGDDSDDEDFDEDEDEEEDDADRHIEL